VSKRLCQTKADMFGKKFQKYYFDFFTLKTVKTKYSFDKSLKIKLLKKKKKGFFYLKALFFKHNSKHALICTSKRYLLS
jgi:hypothetical protein